MITALDTSVLLDIFGADPRFVERSQHALRQAIREGALVACEVVWAELRPWFADEAALVTAMDTLDVVFVPLNRAAALQAGEAWQRYRAQGGPRSHLVPDFLIAAHAVHEADRLLTRDRGFYRGWFSELTVLHP